MGTTCSCVGPCDKPSCFSNLKYKLQYTAENRRQNRQCPCTNRRPKCLRRRRRRQNPFCDCEEMTVQKTQFCHDCDCPLYDPSEGTPPPQHKTTLRSRSISTPTQINLFPCIGQQAQNLRPTTPGCQARPSTPATKEAYTCTTTEEAPPSEPPIARVNKCPRSKPPTPVCPRKTVCTCTNKEEPSETCSPQPKYPRSKPSSPAYQRKPYTSTVETETMPYVPSPTYVQKSCLRSSQHTAVCPKRMNTKAIEASIQVQRPDRQTMRARSPLESRSPSPTCNKETCPFINGYLTRPPSPENTKKICICTTTDNDQEDDSNANDKKNICRFTVDAYFV